MMDNNIGIGTKTKSGFRLNKKVESLDEFWDVLNKEKSIFARHRMYPTAFFFNWSIRLINIWIIRGWFYIANKE